jgi:hypothetical protein
MTSQEMHITLQIKGANKPENQRKIRMFHFMLNRLDTDWPFAVLRYGSGGSTYKRMVCEKCGGRLYRNPRLKPGDIKTFGKQFGLNVKVLRYGRANRCDADGKGLCYKFRYEHGFVQRPLTM